MKIILSVDENWGIGKDNGMLFHLKKDLEHFKETTLNSLVIMGRNTYESMGHALSSRENIVMTKDSNYSLNDAKVCNSKEEVLAYIENSKKEAFVIGGARIVDLFLEDCDEAIITKIRAKKDADTFLHNFDTDPNFKKVYESEVMEEDKIQFTYVTYRRI